jgi:ribonucleoside-diphosphate reductase alpha chain
MLMQAGIPYDSEEGRAICSMLTAILTGRSYRMSAVMAGQLGPFPGYAADKESMLRVMRNHRFAAHGEARSSKKYESLRITPVPIDHALVKSGKVALANAKELLTHSTQAWDDALSMGQKHGYRNAQTTVIAPTGTIGLLMDCDTTGVEPDFALVKFKKLAGGGYFKIANESVRPALSALGYTDAEVKDIMAYILGRLTLEVAMPTRAGARSGETLHGWLKSKGLSDADLQKVADTLPGVFELSFAFSAWSLSDVALQACGLDPMAAKADPSFNLLSALGLGQDQIDELNTVICGTSTIEGSPHLKAAHLPVFDCANKCGKLGLRFIAPQGHIRMMAAAQPFISGAISKTINLPNEASEQDIKDCYRMSWELGLKANALYRDGCKLSQPLSATADEAKKESGKTETKAAPGLEQSSSKKVERGSVDLLESALAGTLVAKSEPAHGHENGHTVEAKPVAPPRVETRPMRRRLQDTRQSLTHKFNVAGHEGYLTVGLYEDGQPGELFITMSKEGSTIGGVMDSLGTATSVALQYGVPISSLVSKFSHQRFEPAGMTENPDIPFAKSLVDYIFRWLGMQFIPGYREANSPRAIAAAAAGHQKEEQQLWKSDRMSVTGGGDGGGVARGGIAAAIVAEATRSVKSATPAAGADGILVRTSTLTLAMASVSDAPGCDVCGTITVRSGTCYKCLECGNSMGCS